MKRISRNQAQYLEHIRNNPGCCTADVVRACKWNPLAGHKYIYDGVARLIRRGFLTCTPSTSGRSRGLLHIRES